MPGHQKFEAAMRHIVWGLLSLMLICSGVSGQTWEWRTPRPTGMQIWGISAVTADTLWMGDQAGIVHRSYNGGRNWERLFAPVRVPRPLIFFVDSEYGWVVGGVANAGQMGLILHTENGGTTWVQQAANVSHFINDVDFIDRNYGWVLARARANGPDMILGTVDGGDTWDTLSVFTGAWISGIDFVSPDLGWALAHGSIGDTCQVLVTFNGGISWYNQYFFRDTYFSDVCFLDEDNGWAVSSSGTLHQTTDGGHNWTTQRPDTTAFGYAKLTFADARHGWIAFGGNHRKILSTDDGGESWSTYQANSGIGLNMMDSGDSSHVWVGGSYGHILHSENSGGNWENLSQRLDLGGIVDGVFVDSLRGWLFGSRTVDGVQRDVIWRTSDGTQTWDDLSRGTNDRYNLGDFVSRDTGWLLANTGTLLRTYNGGENWEATNGLAGWNVSALDFWDSSHGVAVAGQTILTTTDGGNTWSDFSLLDSVGFSDIDFADADNIWAVGFRHISDWPEPENYLNVRAHSSDGGQNWDIEVFEDATLAFTEVEFASQQLGFIVNAVNNSVLRTEDEGDNWEVVAVPVSNEVKKLIATSVDNIWAVWNFNEIIQSRDGGDTWQRHPVINTDWIRTMMATDSSHCWAVTIYNSLFRYGSSVLGVDDKLTPVSPNDFNFSVWPNPFNPTTNVAFDIRESGRGTIRVYDVTGRLVEVLADDYFLAGRHSLLFNAQRLASGSYFLGLSMPSGHSVTRVVLVR